MRSFLRHSAVAVTLVAALSGIVAAADVKHGLDIEGMNTALKPGDDFFRFANGTWLDKTEIPADRSSYGVFVMLAEEANKRTVGLIENAEKSNPAAGSDERKVADYYAAYMNEKAIEEKGLSPIAPELKAIKAIQDRRSLARFLGTQLRADVDPLNATNFETDRLFGVWVSPDLNQPDRMVPYLLQGGLGLPDRDNYVSDDPKDVELLKKYRDHIAAVLKLAKIGDADAKADRILALEKKIAATHATRTDSADVQKANNPWKLDEFAKQAPGMDWTSYFAAAGLTRAPVMIVWHPSAAKGISKLVADAPLSEWKDYLTFRTLDRSSGLLPKAFADERFRFYGTTLTGAPEQRARSKRAVDATSYALGDAVGKMYVKEYFPPQAKKVAEEMVANIVAAFRERVDRLAWMSPETRAKAKAKLDTLYVGVGYPESWRDYSELKVLRDDALGNVRRYEEFEYRDRIAKIGQPVDRKEWYMTPQTVNALNLPIQNALNFPAAILAPPFFDLEADPVQNYGGIGTVIGHEISHSFDDQGSQFDAVGRLRNWWTAEDLAHFQAAGQALAAQYDKYEPLPGLHVNGKLTLSENIADVAGVAAAFDGYRRAYGGKPAPDAQGLTGDQRFFVSFAQIWRSKARPEALRRSIMTNGHAPGEFRADTVRNIDAWYAAFDVKPGEKLYLSPDQRVQPW